MTIEEFNSKYVGYLTNGYKGLTIDNQRIIDYLDIEILNQTLNQSNFEYQEISIKNGFANVKTYAPPQQNKIWENNINKLLK